MSETMLDRLADAVMADEAWSSFWSRAECKALLRATLRELRHPSGAMIDAGARTFEPDGYGRYSIRGQPTAAWQAMIDAILEGKA